jgi:5'-phosphate synthase pdxT subunit
MEIKIERNAFGRQVDSFETDIVIPDLQQVEEVNRPFHAVFIRAPLFDAVQAPARVLGALPDGRIVGKKLWLPLSPELTETTVFIVISYAWRNEHASF